MDLSKVLNVAMRSGHTAVVLAAGGSRRLGFAKQLLRINGESLVHRAARMALETRPEQAILILGSNAEQMHQALAGLDIPIGINHSWQSGVASSIDCAKKCLKRLDGPILLLGCDQPALSVDILHALLESAYAAASGCAASVYAGTIGSPAVISSSRFWKLPTQRSDFGFGEMLRGLVRQELGVVEAPQLELDVDTKQDLQRALSLRLVDRWN